MAEKRPLGFGRHESHGSDGADAPAGPPTMDDQAAAALLPERPARGHKGTFGKVLVVAGSIDYAGAALLVCRAAGRAGAGLVTLAVPETLQPLFAAKVVEATTMALPEDAVNVKATTGERMGFVGRGEGAAAMAVATLEQRG